MNNKNSAIFLATVLITGIIGISSPFAASAQEYDGYNKEYKKDDPYKMKEEKKYGEGPTYKKTKCDNTNINIDVIDQTQIPERELNAEKRIDRSSESNDLTLDELLNLLSGNSNGDPLLNLDKNIVNICFNNNYNGLYAGFFGEPTQAPENVLQALS